MGSNESIDREKSTFKELKNVKKIVLFGACYKSELSLNFLRNYGYFACFKCCTFLFVPVITLNFMIKLFSSYLFKSCTQSFACFKPSENVYVSHVMYLLYLYFCHCINAEL